MAVSMWRSLLLLVACCLAGGVSALVADPASGQVRQSPGLSCLGREATIVGTDGADILVGTDGPDVIVGLGGNDRIFAGRGNDVVCGGPGRDRLRGQSGDDVLLGGAGRDRLFGGSGDDRIRGGRGVDRMLGQSGDDTLLVDARDRRVSAGSGIDACSAARSMLVDGHSCDRLLGAAISTSDLCTLDAVSEILPNRFSSDVSVVAGEIVAMAEEAGAEWFLGIHGDSFGENLLGWSSPDVTKGVLALSLERFPEEAEESERDRLLRPLCELGASVQVTDMREDLAGPLRRVRIALVNETTSCGEECSYGMRFPVLSNMNDPLAAPLENFHFVRVTGVAGEVDGWSDGTLVSLGLGQGMSGQVLSFEEVDSYLSNDVPDDYGSRQQYDAAIAYAEVFDSDARDMIRDVIERVCSSTDRSASYRLELTEALDALGLSWGINITNGTTEVVPFDEFAATLISEFRNPVSGACAGERVPLESPSTSLAGQARR